MLPKAHRLHLSADIRQVLRRGRRFTFPDSVVSVLKTDQEPSKFGLVTPKSVGNAVHRHRLARKLRHAAQPTLLAMPFGWSMVVRGLNPDALELSVTDWTERLNECLTKAGL